MSLHVRPITADELLAWTDVTHVAFHNSRPAAAASIDLRRDLLGDDFSRTLATFVDDRIVGTYESFGAELTLPGGAAVPADAVTAVSVLPTHHRRGALTQMIAQDLHAARQRGEVASVLIAAEYPIYGRFGFGAATDRAAYRLETAYATFTRTPAGNVDLLRPEELREIAPGLFDRFRRAHPGQIDRRPLSWDLRFGLRETPWRGPDHPPRCALYVGASGEPEGYLTYRVTSDWRDQVPAGKLEVGELIAISDDAYLGLWRYMADIDLVTEISADMRRVDEPLGWQLTNARRALLQTARSDFLWVRPLDTARLLEARRYAVEDRVVFEVHDPLDVTGGRFALEGGPAGARCRPTDATPDLSLSMPALGAISLGGVSLNVLHAAGVIDEERAGGLDRAERLFHWPVAPWCSTFF